MAKRKRESISFLGESSGIEMDSTLGLLQELAAEARIPGPQQLVHKDECIYSFDSPVCFDVNIFNFFCIIFILLITHMGSTCVPEWALCGL